MSLYDALVHQSRFPCTKLRLNALWYTRTAFLKRLPIRIVSVTAIGPNVLGGGQLVFKRGYSRILPFGEFDKDQFNHQIADRKNV